MAHLFDHDASNGTAIPIRWCGFKQVPLLLDAGKLRVSLVDDQVHERVAHLLRGNLAQVLALAPSLERAKLNFLRLDAAVERVEFETGNLVAVDANFLAPFVEQTDPVAEGPDFCNFPWHKI